jgi:hypothetical protein
MPDGPQLASRLLLLLQLHASLITGPRSGRARGERRRQRRPAAAAARWPARALEPEIPGAPRRSPWSPATRWPSCRTRCTTATSSTAWRRCGTRSRARGTTAESGCSWCAARPPPAASLAPAPPARAARAHAAAAAASRRPLQLSGAAGAPQATCKRFSEFCEQKGIALGAKGFTLSYDTNIPRQTGLSGSSGIVCAGALSGMAAPAAAGCRRRQLPPAPAAPSRPRPRARAGRGPAAERLPPPPLRRCSAKLPDALLRRGGAHPAGGAARAGAERRAGAGHHRRAAGQGHPGAAGAPLMCPAWRPGAAGGGRSRQAGWRGWGMCLSWVPPAGAHAGSPAGAATTPHPPPPPHTHPPTPPPTGVRRRRVHGL